MSTVDVVVPCYNYGRYLRRCIQSVLTQDGVDVRVLIIDDCSSDDTRAIGTAIEAGDSRVLYVRHRRNEGHIITYNEGLLSWASAEYSLLLSADDLLVPGALNRAATILERHPEAGLCYGMVVTFVDGEEDGLLIRSDRPDYQLIPGLRFLRHCCRFATNPIQTAAAVVRTQTQKELGGYRQNLPHSGDLEMWMRFATHGPIAVTRAVQGLYRQHSRAMSTDYYQRSMLGDIRQRAEAFESLFAAYCLAPARRDLRTAWSRKLQDEALVWADLAFEGGDSELCSELQSLGARIRPQVRTTTAWWKLQIKRRLGLRLWKRLEAQVRRLRPLDPQTVEGSRPTSCREVGWWPTDEF